MEEQQIADPIPSGDARRASALIVWLLFAVSVPPALSLALPALADPANNFWYLGRSIDRGWRAAGALGVVASPCSVFFATWGHFVPPLLAALALGRLLTVRRAVVLTAAYIVTMAVICAFWRLYFWLQLAQNTSARNVTYDSLDVFLRSVFPGIVPLVLAWRQPISEDFQWHRAAGVTRLVLVSIGALGLLLIGFVALSGVGRPFGSAAGSYYARHGLEAVAHVAQLYCGYRLVRHGVLRRRWLWLATAGAALAWGLSLMLAQTLESVATVRIRLPREERFLLQGLLASLAAAAGVLLWYWWPVLVGRVPPQLTDEPLCPTCGYNLTGNVSGRCPECGTATGEPTEAGG